MSNTATETNIEEIAICEFDDSELLKQQDNYNIRKWTDIEIGKLYTITNVGMIDTQNENKNKKHDMVFT